MYDKSNLQASVSTGHRDEVIFALDMIIGSLLCMVSYP